VKYRLTAAAACMVGCVAGYLSAQLLSVPVSTRSHVTDWSMALFGGLGVGLVMRLYGEEYVRKSSIFRFRQKEQR